MNKTSDVLESVITSNPELLFGFNHGLFNLTQLASFLKPIVAARAKREVSEKALLMALSRMQRQRSETPTKRTADFAIERVSVNTDLYIATFYKSRENHSAVVSLYKQVHKQDGYMSVSESSSEITVIVEDEFHEAIKQLFPTKPLAECRGAVSIGIRFHKRYLNVPGYLYKVLQVLTLQNINILELSSTMTEISVYVDPKDTQLAMATIINSFRRQRASR
jgi:aspartokinase